jgi:hypothetical protein
VYTFEHCSLPPFVSRREWFAHELAAHRCEWRCRICRTVCTAGAEFDKHLQSAHLLAGAVAAADGPSKSSSSSSSSPTTTAATATVATAATAATATTIVAYQLALYHSMWQRPATTFAAAECPFCDDWADREHARQQELVLPSMTAMPNACGSWRVSAARFCQHIGRHLEQLVLATLHAPPPL